MVDLFCEGSRPIPVRSPIGGQGVRAGDLLDRPRQGDLDRSSLPNAYLGILSTSPGRRHCRSCRLVDGAAATRRSSLAGPGCPSRSRPLRSTLGTTATPSGRKPLLVTRFLLPGRGCMWCNELIDPTARAPAAGALSRVHGHLPQLDPAEPGINNGHLSPADTGGMSARTASMAAASTREVLPPTDDCPGQPRG